MNLTQYKDEYGVPKMREMAESIGTSYPYLYQLEAGKRNVSAKMALKIEIASDKKITKEELRPDIFGTPKLNTNGQNIGENPSKQEISNANNPTTRTNRKKEPSRNGELHAVPVSGVAPFKTINWRVYLRSDKNGNYFIVNRTLPKRATERNKCRKCCEELE